MTGQASQRVYRSMFCWCSNAQLDVLLRKVEDSNSFSAVHLNPVLIHLLESGQQKSKYVFLLYSLPSTVKVTSHCSSPVSHVYVPESSGIRLWIRSWWNAPLFFRSYLRPAWMVMLFLLQVTVAFGSEMVQARVTVSPSNARVLCGFSSISTANMGNQN